VALEEDRERVRNYMTENKRAGPNGRSPDELRDTSWRLSRQIIEMTMQAGSGQPAPRR
jgi:hypothetical protein